MIFYDWGTNVWEIIVLVDGRAPKLCICDRCKLAYEQKIGINFRKVFKDE